MMAGIVKSTFTATLTSDASSSWSCGAFTLTGDWFRLQWPDFWASIHITVKELLPIVMGIALRQLFAMLV